MKKLLSLFFTFAKIGLFSFGGGYAMLPMFFRVIADEKKWASEEEILNIYAIAQCTPGVIAVNTATFVGAKQKGVAGAVFATLGMIFPSVVIITIIAALMENFTDNQTALNAFSGIRIAACALITHAFFKVARSSVIDVITGLIAVSAFVGVAFFGVSPVVIIPAAGAVGAVKALINTRREN